MITFGYAEIDRIFYEKLRLRVVAMGLLPDVTAYTNNTDWKAARAALKVILEAQGKCLVDVIGVGSWDDRDEKTDARIVVNRTNNTSGSLGGFPATFFVARGIGAQAVYDKYYYPDSTDDIAYEVRIMSNKVGMDRILSAIMDSALPRRRFVSTIGDNGAPTGNHVLLLNTGSYDMSDRRNLERAYRYTVENVFIREPELIDANIPALTTVQYGVYLPDDEINSETFTIGNSPTPTTNPHVGFPYTLPIIFSNNPIPGINFPYSFPIEFGSEEPPLQTLPYFLPFPF